MSEYSQIKTQFKDAKILCESLQDMGFKEVELHTTPQNLYGYHGDKRKDTAEVIIRRKHVGLASNDIGFLKDENGHFQAIISQYDSLHYGQSWLNRLSQRYSEKAVIQKAKTSGLRFIGKKTDEKGHVKLQFVKQ